MAETVNTDSGAKSEEIGAGARVLKEVIKTPAFREILNLYLQKQDPKAARDLVRTLMEQDANLALSLVAASPGMINALAEGLLEIARQLKRFPPELLDSYAGQVLADIDTEKLQELPRAWGPLLVKALPELINVKAHMLQAAADSFLSLEPKERMELIRTACRGIDGKAIGRANNAFSKTIQTLAKEQTDLAEELKPALDDLFAGTDFGKLREAVTILTTYETDIFIACIDRIFANPIIIANLIGMIPPMINNGLKLSSHALENIGMPGELIASTLFNTLLDVDRESLGRTITAGSKMIADLHEGNYILGNEEPRFRAVLADLASGVLEHTDTAWVLGAITALAEDMEVAFGVITDLLVQNPDLLAGIVAAQTHAFNLMVKSGANYLSAMSRLPEDRLAACGEALTLGIDKKELARLFNSVLAFQENFLRANPDFCLLDGMVGDIDLELLGGRLQSSAGKVSAAILGAPNVQQALAPEAVGKKINGMLAGFNRRIKERGQSDGSYLKRIADQIDPKELEEAIGNGIGLIRGALFATSRRGMAVVRPVLAAGRFLIRFVIGSWTGNLLGKGGEK